MLLYEWNEKYSLNHPGIDAQHQELFALVNTVQSLDPQTTTRAQIGILFKEFFDYMAHHFRDEEHYMQSIEYPLYYKHKKMHESIIEGMTQILKTKKHVEELQESMRYIAKKWLVEHILENDLKIERWRKSLCVEEGDTQSSLT